MYSCITLSYGKKVSTQVDKQTVASSSLPFVICYVFDYASYLGRSHRNTEVLSWLQKYNIFEQTDFYLKKTALLPINVTTLKKNIL